MLQQPLGEVGEHGVLELDRDSSSAVRQVGVDPSVRVLTELPGIGRLVEVVTDEEPGALHHARDDAGARAARRTDDRRPGGEEPGGEQGREGGLNRQRTSGRRSGGGAARRRRVRCARGTRPGSRHVHRAGVVHLLLVPVARSSPWTGSSRRRRHSRSSSWGSSWRARSWKPCYRARSSRTTPEAVTAYSHPGTSP